MHILSVLLVALCAVQHTLALTPAQWRSQSIYQVLTDRFARTDGSTTASCNAAAGVYCGGTFQGIIKHLDYIQNMGFTAVGKLSLMKQDYSALLTRFRFGSLR